MVSFKEFKEIDLKAAEIIEVEEIPGKDNLFKIIINLGDQERQIVAGIKQFYSKEELKGKKIVVVANLDPAVIGGVKSECMLLAAENTEGGYSLVTVEGPVKPGTRVE